MSNFSAADVKKLRELTGAGMMDCKKALDEIDFEDVAGSSRTKRSCCRCVASATSSTSRWAASVR